MRVRRRTPWVAAVVALACVLAAGCGGAGECGEGTIEEDGVCVPASSITTPGECCGEGTHYDASLQMCVSDFAPTVCEEGSPDPVVLDDGVLECCGCALYELCSITCEMARPGTVSVCGTFRDMETGLAVARDGCQSAAACDPEEPESSGSCSLEPRFYDAVDLAENGTNATPLAVDSLEWNACGAYAARSVALPASGFMAVLIDDSTGLDPARDDFAGAAAIFPVVDEERVEDRDAFALRRSTDDGWTAAAGDPFGGATFTAHGAEMVRFLRRGDPQSGVAVTDDLGEPLGATYYFADARASFGSLEPSQDATGVDGAALVAAEEPVTVYAEGGLPGECIWPEGLVEPIPGFLLVSDRVAEVEASGLECD